MLLQLDGVCSFYDHVQALRDVSLEVDEAEIVAVIGANGAGKSTTLRTISGIVRPRSGQITFDGQSVTSMPADQMVARGIAHVPEGRRLFPKMSVRENLVVGAFRAGWRDRQATLGEVFRLLPRLAEREEQVAGTLSGGEQQMVAIGRALMARPRFLMLDEPSLGLAPKLVDTVFERITEIKDQGVTILLIEQNARRALAIADRGYVMETGRVTNAGSAAELLEDPSVQEAYLGVR